MEGCFWGQMNIGRGHGSGTKRAAIYDKLSTHFAEPGWRRVWNCACWQIDPASSTTSLGSYQSLPVCEEWQNVVLGCFFYRTKRDFRIHEKKTMLSMIAKLLGPFDFINRRTVLKQAHVSRSPGCAHRPHEPSCDAKLLYWDDLPCRLLIYCRQWTGLSDLTRLQGIAVPGKTWPCLGVCQLLCAQRLAQLLLQLLLQRVDKSLSPHMFPQ